MSSKVNLLETKAYWAAAAKANEQPECPVCFDNTGVMIPLIPCFHKYHPDCITRWINQPTPGGLPPSENCPECRNTIRTRRSSISGQVVPVPQNNSLIPIPQSPEHLVDRVVQRHLSSNHPSQIRPNTYLFYAGFYVVGYIRQPPPPKQ